MIDWRSIPRSGRLFTVLCTLVAGLLPVAEGRAQEEAPGWETLVPVGAFLDGVFPARAPDGEGGFEPPSLLSETGAFVDLATLEPRAGLLPYGVNSPLWTDGSVKKRWIAIPNDGLADSADEKIRFRADASWTFPAGTVLVKQFDLPVDAREPSRIRRVETRFIVRVNDGSVYGVTYRWRPDGSDAELLTTGLEEDLDVTSANGTVSQQTWSFPSREDCVYCHNASAGHVLGVRTHQLNGDYAYEVTGRTANQLSTWNQLGLFEPALDEAAIPNLLRAAPLDDETVAVEHRVRSYLDANCSSCHHPDYLAATFDARLTTPLEEQAMVDGLVIYELGVPNARVVAPQSIERSLLHRRMSALGLHQMPPIGRNVVDRDAVARVSEWILSLEPDEGGTGNGPPVAQNDEVATPEGTPVDVVVLANDVDPDDEAISVVTWSSGTNGIVTPGPNGSLRYEPAEGFVGSDVFTYAVEDPLGQRSNIAEVKVRVFQSENEATIAFLDASNRLSDPTNASRICVAVADMDQDGYDDIVLLDDGLRLMVDHQTPEGAVFVGQSLGDFGGQLQLGLCVADADGNGFPDILHGGYFDGLYLHWNEGGRQAYTRASLLEPRVFLQAVNFADIDGDGWLDIFACHDIGDSAKFRNLGGRQFAADNLLVDTRTTPISDNSGNYGSVWTDYDADGDLDLYLSKCRSGVTNSQDPRRVNMFMRNDGNGQFTNVAPILGMDFGQQSWAADFADVDNDGDLDCFVGNHGAQSLLLLNNGDGTFADRTHASGIEVFWRVMQNIFRDFNNDGWVDLLVLGETHELWMNDRDGTFSKAANPFTNLPVQSGAVGDLNRDGFTDVYAAYARPNENPDLKNPDKLFLASPNGNGFLSVSLQGVESNPMGVGARLELHGAWGIQMREVRGGESYGIAHSFTQIFGLGNAAKADKLIVHWPSGNRDEILDIDANQFLEIREGSSAPPQLLIDASRVNQVGDLVVVDLVAEDPTGGPLQFSVLSLPAGLRLDRESGRIEGVLAPAAAGSHTVLVSVSDEWNTVSQWINWEVASSDSRPAAALSTDAATVEGAFEVRVRFTREVTGLALDDFELSNGAAAGLQGNGAVYSLTVTPSVAGEVRVRLPEGRVTDLEGSSNLESNTLPVLYEVPAGPPVILEFRAEPNEIAQGGESRLSWEIRDGGATVTALTLEPGMGSVLGANEQVVRPDTNTTYTLRAVNEVGVVEASVSVSVEQPQPETDALAQLQAPGNVAHGETVSVSIDYSASQERELWVWLQDSNDNWRTAAQGDVMVGPGSGRHVFSLTIDSAARVGDGYVWAVRLLPVGWDAASDALGQEYSLADVQASDLPPERDLLGSPALPEVVQSPGEVDLAIPYQATERREIRVFLHDSEDNWFTVAQGNTTVEAGSGTEVMRLPVLPQAREGSGYVWAVRLLPLGWTVAEDALDADYGQASVERNTGGTATQDLLTAVVAPGEVSPTETVSVTIDYSATERRDLGIWLHDSTDSWRTIGHGLVKVQPGIAQETFNLGIVGDARLGAGYVWAVRLLPEGWSTSDEALDAFYKDAAVVPGGSDETLVNLAVLPSASATQSSVYGSYFQANLARDGNADGDWRNGSVTHTEMEVDPWWEVDLGDVRSIDHLLLWNRTDCCADRLSAYHVFLSETPFTSSNVADLRQAPGVEHHVYSEAPRPTQRIEITRPARYVRVQLDGANYLSLAEVEVYGRASDEALRGLSYAYYEGTWASMPDLESLNPLSTGTLRNLSLSPRGRDDYFALRYRGCLQLAAAGDYTFWLRADAEAEWDINGETVVSGGGEEVSVALTLGAGRHPFEIRYLETTGDEELTWEWAGPGFSREPIPDEALLVNENGGMLGFHHVGRRVPSEDNADGDLLDITAEYALGRNPFLATMDDIGIRLESVSNGDGEEIQISYDRPANLVEIDYWLEVSSDLSQWLALPTPDLVESPSYGWERVTYRGLDALDGMGSCGFVRLAMRHHDWSHETRTPILAWADTVLREGYQTHAVTLGAQPSYASWVDGVDPDSGSLVMASGGLSELVFNGEYYVELMDGPLEGYRWDIDETATQDQVLRLDLGSARNTVGALPEEGVIFSQAVLRRHRTLGEVYPVDQFRGQSDPSSADQVLFYGSRGYEAYFLLEGGGRRHWTALGEVSLSDAGGVILPPGSGAFAKLASPEVKVRVLGQLREHAFTHRLRPGYQLLAPGSPLAGSPASMGLVANDELVASDDPTRADQFLLWLGDGEDPGSPAAYDSYFLFGSDTILEAYWTDLKDPLLGNGNERDLFPGDRAFFFRTPVERERRVRSQGASEQARGGGN